MTRTVLFVCPHGAGKSRMAAAYFNLNRPSGWDAVSAGEHPQETVGSNAVRLLAGTEAEAFLDLSQPRSVESVLGPEWTVAIDCAVASADERWGLQHQEFDDGMRAEIRSRVEKLVDDLARR